MNVTIGPIRTYRNGRNDVGADPFREQADAYHRLSEEYTAYVLRTRALRTSVQELGWTGLPKYAIAYAAAIRDVLLLIDGETPDPFDQVTE